MTNVSPPAPETRRCGATLADATSALNSWVEVNLAAQARNVASLKAELGRGVDLIAVVKANAYGAGIEGVAAALETAGVDRFAVVWLDEALRLRALGLTRPIIVLGHTPPPRAAEAVNGGITLTCESLDLARALSAAAAAAGRVAKLHIHIDSGLHRDGLTPAEGLELAIAARSLPGLLVEGLSTHMANSDELDDSYSDAQYAAFERVAAELAWAPYRHAANSATALRRGAFRLNGVRIGLALHGILPANTAGPQLEPVLALRGRLIRVHEVPTGEGVSYGLTWRAPRPSRLGLVPIGYADGWRRGLGNLGAVLVNGHRCPMVGRVCMDQFLIDITAAGPVEVGQVATLIGTDGSAAIRAEDVAAEAGTIPWDTLSSLQARLPRIFHRDGLVESVTDSGGLHHA